MKLLLNKTDFIPTKYCTILDTTGFPVDGILQVEEEEEEVDNDDSDSDDRNTYTVEDDYDRETSGRRTVGGRRATGAPLLNQHGTDIFDKFKCYYFLTHY